MAEEEMTYDDDRHFLSINPRVSSCFLSIGPLRDLFIVPFHHRLALRIRYNLQ